MKKIFALTLALVMALSLLTACGGKEDPKPSGNTDTPPAASQQEQTSAPEPDTSKQEQDTPDPGASSDNEEDKDISWPDNEFTKLLPKPEFGELKLATMLNPFMFIFTAGGTRDDARAYLELLKETGWTVEEEPLEDSETMLVFSATHSDGYTLELTYLNDEEGENVTGDMQQAAQ